ncbi:Calcium-binding protein 39-like [Vitis vinifera]|uniref:Calcium-binding protein 39-like n=1 Tax=Vitis vinifera TaxID=29760 RepID=A0A438KKM4_VITVI|nr:Calcium-binding protein 39-like [Vitis vinifera]
MPGFATLHVQILDACASYLQVQSDLRKVLILYEALPIALEASLKWQEVWMVMGEVLGHELGLISNVNLMVIKAILRSVPTSPIMSLKRRYILESTSFELFFKFVELPNFDVASDAFLTFKDLLTKHGNAVAVFLTAHYDELFLIVCTCMVQVNKKTFFTFIFLHLLIQFFDQYEKLLTSPNYVTRRQSLKVTSLGISFGASKFPYNEALHLRSSVFESYDDIVEGCAAFGHTDKYLVAEDEYHINIV